MTSSEWKRCETLRLLSEGRLLVAEACEILGVSSRHVRRLRRRFESDGVQGLIHGNVGRRPSNRTENGIEQLIVELAKDTYIGFNDHHLTDKLREVEGLDVTRATVRRVLRRNGIKSPRAKRRSKAYRRRERRAQPGHLVLWDGSDHDWLEGRGPKLTLMAAIDDATGKILRGAHFVKEECSAGYLRVLYGMVRYHGIPLEMYMDRHSSLKRNDSNWTIEEQLAGKQEPTQVGRALEEFGIAVRFAKTAQAKGRIERAWGTFQDRLVSELRLLNVSTPEEANKVLELYRQDHNARFAKRAEDPTAVWRRGTGLDLKAICSFRTYAIIGNDHTVAYQGGTYDVRAGSGGHSRAGLQAELRHGIDDTLRIYAQEEQIAIHAVATPKKSPPRKRTAKTTRKKKGKRKPNLTFEQIKNKVRNKRAA